MKVDCKHVWDCLSDYLDQSVEPEILAAIERHLESCAICSAILDSTRNILVLSADERVFELPAGFAERLHNRLDRVLQEEDSSDTKL